MLTTQEHFCEWLVQQKVVLVTDANILQCVYHTFLSILRRVWKQDYSNTTLLSYICCQLASSLARRAGLGTRLVVSILSTSDIPLHPVTHPYTVHWASVPLLEIHPLHYECTGDTPPTLCILPVCCVFTSLLRCLIPNSSSLNITR